MRLTSVLMKESYRWRFKQLWKVKGLVHPLTVRMPTFVKECVDDGSLKVQTASDILKPELKFPRWEPPVQDDPQTMKEKTIQDNPDYHEDWVYEYAAQVRLMEGEKQALLLTKSQPFYELPPVVKSYVGRITLPDQDLLMQRVIMQSNIWDPSKDKLPKRYDSRLPGWHFKAEWGIRNGRIASTVVRNLVQLCAMALPDANHTRRTIVDPLLSSFYFFDGKHVMVNTKSDLMVCVRDAVPPFADETAVDASTTYKLPDIFPLAPTIDLRKQHVWRADIHPGWAEGFSHPHTHMMFVTYDDWWSTSQRNAKALMFCYGQAVAMAKQRYGFDVGKLAVPISVCCVMTNGVQFSFTCFQLNTLDVGEASGGSGVKNLVWFDSDNAMYSKILPKRAMLRNTRYEDYDPEVLKKLFAIYAYGS